MSEFHTYLTLESPLLPTPGPDTEQASVLDGVKAGVCECLILFMERNEEEFAKFLQVGAGGVVREGAAAGRAVLLGVRRRRMASSCRLGWLRAGVGLAGLGGAGGPLEGCGMGGRRAQRVPVIVGATLRGMAQLL